MISSATFALFLATSANANGAQQCEAHIFPTDRIEGLTRLGDYGLVSDLLSGGDAPKAAMLAQIKADKQFEIARSLLSGDGYLEGFAFIEHTEPVEFKASTKQKSRLTNSAAPCYVEVVVNYIAFSDSALTKQKVGVHFVTRDFRERPAKPRIVKLGGAAAIAPYTKPTDSPQAEREVNFLGVYTEAFKAAIERFWKK